MLRFASLLLTGAALAGCATTPDVTFQYYPAKSTTTLSVTQTIACAKDKQSLVVTTTPQPAKTVYTADYAAGPYTLQARGIDGNFADASVGVVLQDDGRLKSVTSSWTGKGQEIATAAFQLIGAVAAVAGSEAAGEPKEPTPTGDCAVVENRGNGQPVALTYALNADLAQVGAGDFPLQVSDPKFHDQLKTLPGIKVHLDAFAMADGGGRYDCEPAAHDAVAVKLRRVGVVHVQYRLDSSTMALDDVTVPATGMEEKKSVFCVGVPKAAWFGAGSFELDLADSGAINTLKYGKTNGTDQALTTVQNFINTAAPPSGGTAAPPPGSP